MTVKASTSLSSPTSDNQPSGPTAGALRPAFSHVFDLVDPRARELADSLPGIVWISRADGHLEYFNRPWYDYTGARPEQSLGMAWIELVHGDDRDKTLARWRQAVESGEPFQSEFRIRRASDASYRWHLARSIPKRDATGQIAHWFGSATDLHDIHEGHNLAQAAAAIESLKRYNEDLEKRVAERTAELRESNIRLQLSNRELQDFASVASHDLQEPLRKIQAFGDRLATRAGDSLGPEGEDYLRRMKNAAARMQTLIGDLLSFSRVTTNARPFVPVDLRKIADEVMSDLETSVEKHGGRVELGDLPTLDADPLQMRQLLQNLICNALKFHKPGVHTDIRVNASILTSENEPATELCELRVQDNGIGFDEKYLDRIFNVFQRLHGRNTYEGTGIGLAVCRKIAERHGGSITACSTPDVGSTFIVTLPVHHDPSAAGPALEEIDAR